MNIYDAIVKAKENMTLAERAAFLPTLVYSKPALKFLLGNSFLCYYCERWLTPGQNWSQHAENCKGKR